MWSRILHRFLRCSHLIFSACLAYTTWQHLPSTPSVPRLFIYVTASVSTASYMFHAFMVSFAIVTRRHVANIFLEKGKITIKLRRPLGVRPGQYIDLRVMKGLYSVLSYPITVIIGSEEPIKEIELFVEPQTVLFNHLQQPRHSSRKAQSASSSNEQVVRGRRFAEMQQMTVFSGPYGEPIPDEMYSKIVWLSFGPLISSMAPYLIQIVRKAKRGGLVVWQVKSKGSIPISEV